MKKLIMILVSSSVIFSCATKQGYEGAVTGGTAGAIIGSAVDKENPWRGAFIGGIVGAVITGTIADVSAVAAEESYKYNKTVIYKCHHNCRRNIKIIAVPIGRGRCKTIQLKYFENNKLVKVKKEKICKIPKRHKYMGY
jgi:gas vesicle protein